MNSVGFSIDPSAVRSAELHRAVAAWRAEGGLGRGALPATFALGGWSMLVRVEPAPFQPFRVYYRAIAESIRRSGFDFPGRYLDEIKLPTSDFFHSAYELILRHRKPVFGWHNIVEGSQADPIFEFALLPLSLDLGGAIEVLGLEAWHTASPETVPSAYRGEPARGSILLPRDQLRPIRRPSLILHRSGQPSDRDA